jgi:hypothetical protein
MPRLCGAVGLILLFAGGAANAADRTAVPITCGMIITTDVRLMEDITCSGVWNRKDGLWAVLRVEEDGVDVDLNGHTLTVLSGVGVSIEYHDAVTVRDGTIVGGSIHLHDTSRHVTLERLTLINSYLGLGSSGFIHDNHMVNGEISGDFLAVHNLIVGNLLEDVRITLNGYGDTLLDNTLKGGEIFEDDGDHVSIVGNRLFEASIRLTNKHPHGAVVMDNTVTASRGHGIEVDGWGYGSNSAIVRNRVYRCQGHGIYVTGKGVSLLIGNDADQNGGYGIYAPGGTDGGLNSAKHNLGPDQCVGVSCK